VIFVTGGARSGKSQLAEQLARERAESGTNVITGNAGVTYIATAQADDDEMRKRIAEHRRRRPESWQTIETTDDLTGSLVKALAAGGIVLVDCLTIYISNLLMKPGIDGGAAADARVDAEIEKLVELCQSGNGRVILVSNEVGLGIVPENPLARSFRDLAGRANQRLAAVADEVYFCISGIPMKVK